MMSRLVSDMTYSIFDETGNLIDAFDDRAVAFDRLERIGRAAPEVASDVFLVVESKDGELIGDVVFASTLMS
jgi:hypothetical protein